MRYGNLVSQPIPGFYNGISQQPPSIRLQTQGESQVNAHATLIDGLTKRPGTRHVAELSTNVNANSFVHKINRDPSERYMVIFTGNSADPIEVFKVDGTKCTVRYGHLLEDLTFTADTSVKSYLTVADSPKASLRAMTVVDYTFVSNSEKTVAMTSSVTTGTISGSRNTMVDLPKDHATTTTTVTGDATQTHTTTSAESAPAVGTIFEIYGDEGNDFDSYFVEYKGNNSWQEVAKPGIQDEFDSSTMPHKLVRTGVNEFTFSDIVWERRMVGDDSSCPLPSFVGSSISNLSFFKDRLTFLSEDRVILSRPGLYFNFWNETATEVLDDDPVDTTGSGVKGAVVKFFEASPYEKALFLLSPQQQFILTSGDLLFTPKTASLTPTTAYECVADSNVAIAGPNAYFVSPNGTYTTVREYFIEPDSLLNDAANVTAHCPRYVPKGIMWLEACNSQDMLFIHSDAEPEALYVYKFYWVSDKKPQSAWSKWTFDGNILGFTVIESSIYFVIQREYGVYIEALEVEKVIHSPGFRVHLDRLAVVTGEYDSETDKTTFTLPYEEQVDTKVTVVNSSTGLELLTLDDERTTTTVIARGDRSSPDYLVGIDYEMRYQLSELYIKKEDEPPLLDAKVQVKGLFLTFTDTGYFRVEVTPAYRETMIHEYTASIIGVVQLGTMPLGTGEDRFLIMSKARGCVVELVNDTYLPCAIQSGSFEAILAKRNRRL